MFGDTKGKVLTLRHWQEKAIQVLGGHYTCPVAELIWALAR